MPSSYSNNLKIELIATGEQDGTWGNTTNTNLGTAIEQAIVGRAVVTFASDADLTLTLTTSNAAQDARAVYLVAQSGVSLTASRNLVVPTIFKNYVVKNSTTGSQDIVVKTSGGTGVTVPNGKTVAVYVDGTNVIKEIDYIESLALGGTPTAPTAAPGTNTTQVATTAFVQNVAGALGTMSTQDADNVAITGGSASLNTFSIKGTTSGTAAITAPAIAGTSTYGLPNTSSTLGFLNAPPVGTKTTSYTLATSDIGKYVQVGSGGSITIPDGVFSEGDVVSIFNNTTGNITITCSIATAYIAGADSDKATITLATRGVATVLFISGTVCVVMGTVS